MPVEFDDAALAEAVEARDYYAALRPELGADFAVCLDRAITRIAANPGLWPPFSRHTRRYLLDRFPYAVVYRLRDDSTIRVLAVMHQHRRPGYWSRRG